VISQFGVLVLWTALGATPSGDAECFSDYKQAYLAAQAANRPLLVILNPGSEADVAPLDVDALRRSGHRRKLLGDYVVAVIDASTPAGQTAHKLFGSPALPRVSVIDKQQKWQIYRTSQALTPESWNLVLEKYRTGQAPAAAAPTCSCMNAAR
jgi:hypothetical protein